MPTQQDPAKWRTQGSQTVFENRWVSVHLDDVELPDGRTYEYTRVEPGGIGVGIVGFDPSGKMLLEREYRHGVGQVIWQLPGGLAQDGENLLAAGLRELAEETGFAPAGDLATKAQYLGVIWDNPAFGEAQSHLYAVWNLVYRAKPVRDMAEDITLHWCDPAWICAAVRDGTIRDRVVVAAIAYLLLDDLI